MKKLFLLLIRLYQRFISPFKPPTCRYYPTCSHYAYEAVHRHGAWKGGYLAMARILRCHPFAKGGVDPVPETFYIFQPKHATDNHRDR